jgi:hypothetical protein
MRNAARNRSSFAGMTLPALENPYRIVRNRVRVGPVHGVFPIPLLSG